MGYLFGYKITEEEIIRAGSLVVGHQNTVVIGTKISSFAEGRSSTSGILGYTDGGYFVHLNNTTSSGRLVRIVSISKYPELSRRLLWEAKNKLKKHSPYDIGILANRFDTDEAIDTIDSLLGSLPTNVVDFPYPVNKK